MDIDLEKYFLELENKDFIFKKYESVVSKNYIIKNDIDNKLLHTTEGFFFYDELKKDNFPKYNFLKYDEENLIVCYKLNSSYIGYNFLNNKKVKEVSSYNNKKFNLKKYKKINFNEFYSSILNYENLVKTYNINSKCYFIFKTVNKYSFFSYNYINGIFKKENSSFEYLNNKIKLFKLKKLIKNGNS